MAQMSCLRPNLKAAESEFGRTSRLAFAVLFLGRSTLEELLLLASRAGLKALGADLRLLEAPHEAEAMTSASVSG